MADNKYSAKQLKKFLDYLEKFQGNIDPDVPGNRAPKKKRHDQLLQKQTPNPGGAGRGSKGRMAVPQGGGFHYSREVFVPKREAYLSQQNAPKKSRERATLEDIKRRMGEENFASLFREWVENQEGGDGGSANTGAFTSGDVHTTTYGGNGGGKKRQKADLYVKPETRPLTPPSGKTKVPLEYLTKSGIQIGQVNFNVEFAVTPQQQQLGLSERPLLLSGCGMLFVFGDGNQPRQFHMRGVNFPLDMICISSNKRVVGIKENNIPDHSGTLIDLPPCQFVLEVNGFEARSNGITIGSKVTGIGPIGNFVDELNILKRSPLDLFRRRRGSDLGSEDPEDETEENDSDDRVSQRDELDDLWDEANPFAQDIEQTPDDTPGFDPRDTDPEYPGYEDPPEERPDFPISLPPTRGDSAARTSGAGAIQEGDGVGPDSIARAKERGLVPKSGDWHHPNRWVKPEDADVPAQDVKTPDQRLEEVSKTAKELGYISDDIDMFLNKFDLDNEIDTIYARSRDPNQSGEEYVDRFGETKYRRIFDDINEWHDIYRDLDWTARSEFKGGFSDGLKPFYDKSIDPVTFLHDMRIAWGEKRQEIIQEFYKLQDIENKRRDFPYTQDDWDELKLVEDKAADYLVELAKLDTIHSEMMYSHITTLRDGIFGDLLKDHDYDPESGDQDAIIRQALETGAEPFKDAYNAVVNGPDPYGPEREKVNIVYGGYSFNSSDFQFTHENLNDLVEFLSKQRSSKLISPEKTLSRFDDFLNNKGYTTETRERTHPIGRLSHIGSAEITETRNFPKFFIDKDGDIGGMAQTTTQIYEWPDVEGSVKAIHISSVTIHPLKHFSKSRTMGPETMLGLVREGIESGADFFTTSSLNDHVRDKYKKFGFIRTTPSSDMSSTEPHGGQYSFSHLPGDFDIDYFSDELMLDRETAIREYNKVSRFFKLPPLTVSKEQSTNDEDRELAEYLGTSLGGGWGVSNIEDIEDDKEKKNDNDDDGDGKSYLEKMSAWLSKQAPGADIAGYGDYSRTPHLPHRTTYVSEADLLRDASTERRFFRNKKKKKTKPVQKIAPHVTASPENWHGIGPKKTDAKHVDLSDVLRDIAEGSALNKCEDCDDNCRCAHNAFVDTHGCECDHDCICPDMALSAIDDDGEICFTTEQIELMDCIAVFSKEQDDEEDMGIETTYGYFDHSNSGNVSQIKGDFLEKKKGGRGKVGNIVRTPMKDGKFDSDAVGEGESVWITVTNPSSPLRGRPILLTKRPDGLLAVTGGANTKGMRHYVLGGKPKKTKADKELEEDANAIDAHNEPIQTEIQELRREQRDRLKEAIDDAGKALGFKPGMTKSKVTQWRKDLTAYYIGLGAEPRKARQYANKVMDSYVQHEAARNKEVRKELEVEAAKTGLDLDRINKDLEEGILSAEEADKQKEDLWNEWEETKAGIGGEAEVSMPPISISVDENEETEGTSVSDEEEQQRIDDWFDGEYTDIVTALEGGEDKTENVEGNEEPGDQDHEEGQPFVLPSGLDIGIAPPKPEEEKGKAAPEGAVKGLEQSMFEFKEAKNKENEIGIERRKLQKVKGRPASPMTIGELREAVAKDAESSDVEMSWEDVLSSTEKQYDSWMRTQSSLAFYDALSDVWNENTSLAELAKDSRRADSAMQYHVNSGANTALAAIAREHLGMNVDVNKLINASNLEVASAAIAYDIMRRKAGRMIGGEAVIDPGRLRNVIDEIKTNNEKVIGEAETKALNEYDRLSKQSQDIQDQKKDKQLVETGVIKELELDNLVRMRTTLGSAMGSMQASATVLARLEEALEADGDLTKLSTVSMNVGSGDETTTGIKEAQKLVDRIGLKSGDYSVSEDEDGNYVVQANIAATRGLMRREDASGANLDKLEKIKNNQDGIELDASGNEIVPGYNVPGWNNTFTDTDGNSQTYTWRSQQRNDIEFLLEKTKKSEDTSNRTGDGGAIISRVTGAGKTNTALGFYAHKIAQNPNYRGLVMVPAGRTDQWMEEASRFMDSSKVNLVHIPDNASKSDIEKAMMGAGRGSIIMMSHKAASSVSDTDGILYKIQNGHVKNASGASMPAFDGVVIDEPQELLSSKERVGGPGVATTGRKLMRMKFNNRVGLTATPARRDVGEAYDSLAWAAGGERRKLLGAKASFMKRYEGFGSGTNAQDSAIAKSFQEQIAPLVSGEGTTQSFKVNSSKVTLDRSGAQVNNLKLIEKNATSFLDNYVNKNAGEPSQYENTRWFQAARKQAEAQTGTFSETRQRNAVKREFERQGREELARVRSANMTGAVNVSYANGEFSLESADYTGHPMLNSFATGMMSEANSGKKHVVFVDRAASGARATERHSSQVSSALKGAGYKGEVLDLSTASAASRGEMVSKFKTGGPGVILIDRESASGFNLQQGSSLHVLGNPPDVATYLQAQGRVARDPRVGDVDIVTYRYGDDPRSASLYSDLDQQMKVQSAVSPAMVHMMGHDT